MRSRSIRIQATTDDVGVDWERWCDGRVWHLKRKKHFADVPPKLVMRAAHEAAARMGKAVRTMRDFPSPEKYLWIQFADYEVRLGQPCPCGSRTIIRLHKYFARCPECQSQLILSHASVDEAEPEEEFDRVSGSDETPDPAAGELLDQLTDVHLERVGRSAQHDVYQGYGQGDRGTVHLVVEFLVPNGFRLTPENASDHVAAIHQVQIHHLDSRTAPTREWDLILY